MIAHLVAAGSILLAYAVAVMVATPMVVTRRRWTSRMPRTAISLWTGALGSGGIAMVASLACAVAAAAELASRPRAPLTVQATMTGLGLTLAACAMTALGGGVASVVAYRVVVGTIAQRRLRSGAGAVVARSSRRTPVSPRVVRSDRVTAVSLPGRHPVIVVSSALADALTPDELEAVVEHERGHLLQHHHLLVRLADVQYRCAPILPCARSLERSMHLLVELAADDYAARRCGRSTTLSALRTMATHTGDAGLALRARRLEVRGRSVLTGASHG